MCKIFAVAGIKPSTQDKVWKFAQAIAKPMSKGNNDGLGYAAITAEGKIFGERWLNNNHAFKRPPEGDDNLLMGMFKEALETKNETFEYNSFGEVDLSKMVALTLHTRAATSAKGLANTHPFVQNDTALIHNGIIRNTTDFKFTLSTCDSEAILISYLNKEVGVNPEAINEAAKLLKGYYACGVLTNTEEGPILDIFKSGARMHIAHVKELETYVFSTDDDDIKDTCKLFGYNHGSLFTVMNGRFLRVDALTGKEKSIVKFDPSPEWTTYNYNKDNYNYPTTGNTSTKSNTTTHSSGTAATKKTADVLPYGKKRSNTNVSEGLMDYFRAGDRMCVRLSEREIQEEIMNNERMYGESRW